MVAVLQYMMDDSLVTCGDLRLIKSELEELMELFRHRGNDQAALSVRTLRRRELRQNITPARIAL